MVLFSILFGKVKLSVLPSIASKWRGLRELARLGGGGGVFSVALPSLGPRGGPAWAPGFAPEKALAAPASENDSLKDLRMHGERVSVTRTA